jgi:hypothetical protein
MGFSEQVVSSEPTGSASRIRVAKLAVAGYEYECMASDDEHNVPYLTGAGSLAEVTL